MSLLKNTALVSIIMGDVMFRPLQDFTEMHIDDIYNEIAGSVTKYLKSAIFCDGEDVFEQAEMIARKRLAELIDEQKESDD